jgi:hypothetical protein
MNLWEVSMPATAAEELAREVVESGVPGIRDVTIARPGVRVEFDDGEFVIRVAKVTQDSPLSVVRLTLNAVMRAAPPNLGTWWCEWERTCAPGAVTEAALEEMLGMRTRFRRLLDERNATRRSDVPSGSRDAE